MNTDALTHEQALMVLNDHMGKQVSVFVAMESEGRYWVIVTPMSGVLGKTVLGASQGDLDAEIVTDIKRSLDPAYTVDGSFLNLPPLPGIVRRYELGLEWVLAEGLTLRIDWGGDG